MKKYKYYFILPFLVILFIFLQLYGVFCKKDNNKKTLIMSSTEKCAKVKSHNNSHLCKNNLKPHNYNEKENQNTKQYELTKKEYSKNINISSFSKDNDIIENNMHKELFTDLNANSYENTMKKNIFSDQVILCNQNSNSGKEIIDNLNIVCKNDFKSTKSSSYITNIIDNNGSDISSCNLNTELKLFTYSENLKYMKISYEIKDAQNTKIIFFKELRKVYEENKVFFSFEFKYLLEEYIRLNFNVVVKYLIHQNKEKTNETIIKELICLFNNYLKKQQANNLEIEVTYFISLIKIEDLLQNIFTTVSMLNNKHIS
ncbi:hypothetical protein H312_01481 [Anncaliia algerae PRA339]|uniref:Uncharacterized protein n=1 Tax=Anncaliia algerae PRA339 TaxID=1288291 RepID=A0A059F1S7_9MICR|nr:hypothetical protein H312_01481 [Anncaliia algerae PRA339]